MKTTDEPGDKLLFDLAFFLATSAREIEDYPAYGSLRLITALSRLIELSKQVSGLRESDFLTKVKKEIDGNYKQIMFDKKVYVNMLDNVLEMFINESKDKLGLKRTPRGETYRF